MSSGRGIRGVPMEGYWRDIGDPGSYYRANLDAWEGKLRLPEQRGGALERAPEAFRAGAVRLPGVLRRAAPRAAHARALTAGLMEAGADLTDGLTVRTVPGGVHIAPCADRAALCIESDSPDTARRFEALVRDVERRVENRTGGKRLMRFRRRSMGLIVSCCCREALPGTATAPCRAASQAADAAYSQTSGWLRCG